MFGENPRRGFSKLAPEKIAQVVRIDQQRLSIQTVVEIQPAPLDTILHQRQTKRPLSALTIHFIVLKIVFGPRPEHSPVTKLQRLFRMTLQTRLKCAFVQLSPSGLPDLRV